MSELHHNPLGAERQACMGSDHGGHICRIAAGSIPRERRPHRGPLAPCRACPDRLSAGEASRSYTTDLRDRAYTNWNEWRVVPGLTAAWVKSLQGRMSRCLNMATPQCCEYMAHESCKVKTGFEDKALGKSLWEEGWGPSTDILNIVKLEHACQLALCTRHWIEWPRFRRA